MKSTAKDKVYRVPVVLEIHGHKSKAAALDFLHEALHVDGLSVSGGIQAKQLVLVDSKPNKCCVCGTTVNLHKDGWYGYRCDGEGCVPF